MIMDRIFYNDMYLKDISANSMHVAGEARVVKFINHDVEVDGLVYSRIKRNEVAYNLDCIFEDQPDKWKSVVYSEQLTGMKYKVFYPEFVDERIIPLLRFNPRGSEPIHSKNDYANFLTKLLNKHIKKCGKNYYAYTNRIFTQKIYQFRGLFFEIPVFEYGHYHAVCVSLPVKDLLFINPEILDEWTTRYIVECLTTGPFKGCVSKVFGERQLTHEEATRSLINIWDVAIKVRRIAQRHGAGKLETEYKAAAEINRRY